MSTRHVRRLLEQQQQQQQQQPEETSSPEDSEDESDEGGVAAAPFNPFDLLSDDEGGGDMNNDDNDDDEGEEAPPPLPKPKPPAASQAAGGSKGKKKKKGGKKGAEPEDEIDKLMKEMNLKTAGDAASTSAADSKTFKKEASDLLGVDVRWLRGEDELRQIFGAGVVQSVNREDRAEAAAARRGRTGVRGTAVGRRKPTKKGVLVSPKDHWPPFEGGLVMECVGNKDGYPLYRYNYSPNYKNTQTVFGQIQASMDPNALAAMLQHAPYHVDALLAMCDLYRSMGENVYAEECLSRSLYSLEMGWHSSFNIASGNCRVDFEVEENRSSGGDFKY
eukprot:gene23358-30614_t